MAIITSTQTGNWNTGATWVGGAKPANGDSAVIAADHVVTFDADLATDGIDLVGVTITGTLTAKTTAGDYVLKASGAIGGAGTFNIGSAGTVYPNGTTFTIDFDSTANSIEGESGLTCNFYCEQPTYQYIKLSADEAIGQTELSVDTDVTSDIWAVGDTVYICNIDGGQDVEERVIAAGGISADHIDVTVGLTAAKLEGSYIVLVNRNIKVTNTTDYVFRQIHNSVLGCEVSGCTYGFHSCYSNTCSGPTAGCAYGFYYCYSNTCSGPTTGCSSGFRFCYSNTCSGLMTGCTNGFYYCYSNTCSGPTAGCAYGFHSCYSNTCSGPTAGCAYGFYYCYSNACYGVSFSGTTTEFSGQANVKQAPWSWSPSYDHDAVAGAFKAWTRGGIILSETSILPSGYSVSYKHSCVDTDNPAFRQEEVLIPPGETLKVRGYIKFADDHSSYLPRLEIIDPSADPLCGSGETPLATDSVASGTETNWQQVDVSYKNTGTTAKPVIIRTLAKRASGNVYEGWEITAGGDTSGFNYRQRRYVYS